MNGLWKELAIILGEVIARRWLQELRDTAEDLDRKKIGHATTPRLKHHPESKASDHTSDAK